MLGIVPVIGLLLKQFETPSKKQPEGQGCENYPDQN
jgi:hypothetical protein